MFGKEWTRQTSAIDRPEDFDARDVLEPPSEEEMIEAFGRVELR